MGAEQGTTIDGHDGAESLPEATPEDVEAAIRQLEDDPGEETDEFIIGS